MGWKAATIFVNEGSEGSLGASPVHDPRKAEAVIRELAPGWEGVSTSTLGSALYPREESIALGAYSSGLIFSNPSVMGAVLEPSQPVLQKLLGLFPKATLLVLELHSGFNHFGYALYEGGVLRRAYGGNAEQGVFVEEGALLPEEEPFFEHASPQDGESLVFAISARVLGSPMDRFDLERVPVELFQRKSWWRRLLG